MVTFRPARPADLPIVLELLDEAAAWLQAQGIRQWPQRFSDVSDWRSSRIADYVESGKTWLVYDDATAIATFTLSPDADPDYADGWPDGPNQGLYIFRMAVRRQSAGHDLGGRILDWSGARALSQGKRWLRLDCHRENTKLQAYYETRGFNRVNTLIRTIDDGPTPGTGQRYTRGSGALYQRPAGAVCV